MVNVFASFHSVNFLKYLLSTHHMPSNGTSSEFNGKAVTVPELNQLTERETTEVQPPDPITKREQTHGQIPVPPAPI